MFDGYNGSDPKQLLQTIIQKLTPHDRKLAANMAERHLDKLSKGPIHTLVKEAKNVILLDRLSHITTAHDVYTWVAAPIDLLALKSKIAALQNLTRNRRQSIWVSDIDDTHMCDR